ncbi:probable RNA-dependent RNA polymerase 5 isoform X2 [Fagus crenata]
MLKFKILSAVYSYAVSEAADSWLALMDRLLILGNDCIEQKDRVKANILQLIDIYYDALDAPKKGGQKAEVIQNSPLSRLSCFKLQSLFLE